MNLGHWTAAFPIEELAFGFIYVITNTVSGKKYIGKKQMKSVKKLKPLKGKKNKRHFDVETDWREYMSSSNDLQADIVALGKDKFKFEIVKLCNSKWELSYFESKMQFEANVLLSENYYNGIINCRIGKSPKSHIIKDDGIRKE